MTITKPEVVSLADCNDIPTAKSQVFRVDYLNDLISSTQLDRIYKATAFKPEVALTSFHIRSLAMHSVWGMVTLSIVYTERKTYGVALHMLVYVSNSEHQVNRKY